VSISNPTAVSLIKIKVYSTPDALLFLMISIGIILTSDAGVKHTETGNPLFIASDRQTGTVKI